MAEDNQEAMQHTADVTLTSDATSSSSPEADRPALDEGNEESRSASSGPTADDESSEATPNADDAFSFPPYPANANARPVNEDLWIQLYHHLLLVAALHPTKPLIHLNHPGALQLLDAYTEGLITSEGIVGPLPPTAGAEGIAVFKRVCENLVPSIVARIEEQSKKNFGDEYTEASPDLVEYREPLWKFVITPEMISQYSRIRERFDVGDEIEEPEKHQELREFLENIVAETLGTSESKKSSDMVKPKLSKKSKQKKLEQQPLDERETFRRVGGFIRVTFIGGLHNSNLTFQQVDEIPDLREAPGDGINDGNEEDEKQGEYYLLPTHREVIIPPKSRLGLLWIYNEDTKDWYRADGKRWRPSLVLRQFRRDTNEYTKLHDRTDMFHDLDPNDKRWFDKYNKMMNQKFRRNAGEKQVKHMRWTTAELAEMYKAINTRVSESGLDAFQFKFDKAFVSTIRDRTNAVEGNTRGLDTVRSRIKRRKGPIFELIARAQALKARIDAGEEVPKDERYPEEAIAISDDVDGQEEDQLQDEAENLEESDSDDEDEFQEQDETTGEGIAPGLQQLEEQFVEAAMKESLEDGSNMGNSFEAHHDARSHLRKGKRTYSHGEDNSGSKRPRTKAEDDAAQAEAEARVSAPEGPSEEDEEDEEFLRGLE